MLVKKRDGRVESFKSDKILASIKKAALAVEVKDDDIQRRAAELKSLKNQLIEHGFDEIEAEEQAEEQFEGYLDDGVYTEYDEEEAEEVVDMVLEGIDSLGLDEDDLIDTGLIQDFVEKALLTTGHVKTAKEYIIKRANRERIREMNTSLMKSYEDLTFGKSSEVETKRENANIDGDSSMGTMLKYGSEGAKKFNLLYVVPPEESEAHSNGDIHIHDLDFYSLTETCTCRHSKIIIKDGGPRAKAIETDMGFFDQFLDNYPVDTVVSMLRPIYIYDNGKFTRIKNCVRHSAEGKRVLRIHSKAATFEGTDNHTIPVVTADGGYKELHASEIQVGMRFIDAMYNDDEIKYGYFSPDDFVIISIEELHYDGQYVFDVETTSHYFMTNGVRVHNCCQIDLEKLFHNGFNTGHGFLREPGEIRSYGALACIAIQSNQNDQHGGQSVPAFDHYMAPGVAKTFIKELYRVMCIKYPQCSGKKDSNMSNEDIRDELKKYRNKHRLILDNMDFVKNLIRDKYCKTLDSSEIDLIIRMATEATDDATHQAMEAVVHNLNSMHSRAGAQVPFSSLNFGTDTSAEGRMVSKNLLIATEEGLGNGETPIFPISIFKLKEGVSYNPEDPNYDLFKLACRVSAKRLFPNFSNLDAPYNLQYYHKGDVNTEVAYMGCVQGSETITYKIGESLYVEGIGRAFERLSKLGRVESTGVTEYINLENTREEVTILDSYSGGFVKCKKILKNPNRDNWHRVKFTGGRSLVATADHPLPIKGKGRTFVKDMIVGDIGYLATTDSKVNNEIEITYIDKIVLDEPSYDVETESDRFDVSGIMSHNCRTRVMANVYNPSYEKTSGRGNLSFTSINLPRLGIRAHGSIDRFFKLLDEMLELVHHQLLARFKVQCRKHPRNFPFLMGQGVWIDSDKLGLDDDMTEILKNGTLTVGFIGLAECLKALIGVHHGESEEAQQLGLKIIGHMREMTDKWSQVEHMNYSLIATPAEGLAGRFIRIDKKKYGIIPGVTDRDYYTNSMHVPVYYPINAFKKINIEAPYHALCNGGHITYIELDGDPTKNLDAFMKVVRYMHDAGIGYGAINHPVDRDPICGYQGIIDDVCPRCGRKEDEPMTEEMWQKIKGYPSWANAGHCGTCGDPYEEADRTPNSLTISGDK